MEATSSTVNVERCPVCHCDSYLDWGAGEIDVPAFCNMFSKTREAALSQPLGRVRLAQCARCSHIWNLAFDSAIATYGAGYENSLHFSGTFAAFAAELARDLVNRYKLEGQTVVDIGSGMGDFLRMLRREGAGRAVGFDPSLPFSGSRADDEVELNARLASAADVAGAALVTCRHVLEHVEEPGQLLDTIAGFEDANPALYLEVPSGDYLLEHLAVWDVIHEHPSHFTRASLLYLLSMHGLECQSLSEVFAGQFLAVHARRCGRRSAARPYPEAGALPVSDIGCALTKAVDTWAGRIAGLRKSGKIAVWGAGSKGVTFLNLVPGLADALVVDANPRKRGLFVPATGHEILAPDDLATDGALSVVVMNPLYRDEIAEQLQLRGIEAEVISVMDWPGR